MDSNDKYQGLDPETTLRQAKEWLRERVIGGTGALCPCCGLKARIYVRKLNSSQAATLIFFYRNFEHFKFFHKRELQAKAPVWLRETLGSGEFSKLAYWGLIDEKSKDVSEDKRTSGYWALSQKGCDFVLGKIKVPSHIRLYGGKLLSFSKTLADISQCLGKRFSYYELMGGESYEK